VPRDGDLAFAAGPNVVAAAAADEAPAEGPQAALELPALRGFNLHVYV